MPLAHLVRHQLRQRPSQQLGGGTAEQALRGGVERPKAAVESIATIASAAPRTRNAASESPVDMAGWKIGEIPAEVVDT